MTMTKQRWLDAAEVFDSWRIVPRSLLYGYAYFVWHVFDRLSDRYFSLDAVSIQSVAVATMVGALCAAVTGFSAPILKIYSDSGRDWNKQTTAPQTTTMLATSTTTTGQQP